MTCELSHTTVHGYFDGELDAVRAHEFEGHLASCAECQRALEAVASLRTGLQQSELFEPASPELRERIRLQLAGASERTRVERASRQRWFLVPSFAALALAALIAVFPFLTQSRRQLERNEAELIDAHVRSLQPGHITDVESTDQHTVKPWFDGKLDFVPPVVDYSDRGFPLLGGRLDVLDGHQVAALVYGRRKHMINVFVWPKREWGANFSAFGSRQGFNWVRGQTRDMQFCLISDVSSSDLDELKSLIQP
ncbi:MAG: anti-sigma factor [Acidobacteriaceae bacterium]|nr:anti-sigma factor [Acidobacteriaceae bacterium]